MKLGECILLAANSLGLENVLSDKTQSDTDKLLVCCANNVLDEITSEYLPLKCEVTVSTSDGTIPYSELGNVYDVVNVTKNGVKIDYSLYPSFIEVDGLGEYKVTFYARPNKLEPEDDIPVQLRLTPRIVSYGIIAEYLLVSGLYEEAVTYDRRFKDALNRLAYCNGEKRIKRRRWLL